MGTPRLEGSLQQADGATVWEAQGPSKAEWPESAGKSKVRIHAMMVVVVAQAIALAMGCGVRVRRAA